MGMIEQQEIIQGIGEVLLGFAPEGWEQLRCECSAVAKYSSGSLMVEH
jgi:hypothetical protein